MKNASPLDALKLLRFAALAGAICIGGPVEAQSPPRIAGTLVATFPGDDGSILVKFRCEGSNPCTGLFKANLRRPGCTNTIASVEEILVSGLTVAQPGSVAGTITLKRFEFDDRRNPDGSCSIKAGEDTDATLSFTGAWSGTSGSLSFPPVADRHGKLVQYSGNFSEDAAPPPFGMSASGRADATNASFTAALRFQPRDIGASGSVYAFALAPASIVRPAADGAEPFAVGKAARPDGSKDEAVACVLAQLNSSGQLQAVSASSLQAYVSGVLSGAGQAVTIVNGVSTASIGGTTFFVGYGSNAGAMLSGGLNRSVVSVPGSRECKPQAPQTGWWWNAAEGGRGYSIEVRGNNLFYAGFLYDESGRSTWYVAAGPVSLDGSLFTGNLTRFTGGQTLAGTYKAPGPEQVVGPFTLAFSDDLNGTMAWPGGTVALERFNIVPNGVNSPPLAGVPEGGWWWNESESGRGYFIEWQNGTAFIAGYMYDDSGNPVWYLTTAASTNPSRYAGTWTSFANGQTLTGPYKPATQIDGNVAPVAIQFTSGTTASMTLPGNKTVSLTRFRF